MIGKGGFDVVIGNPPWEVVQLGEEEYFAVRFPEIAAMKGASRKQAIAALEAEHPQIFNQFQTDKRVVDAVNEFARASGRFDLTARGKVNTYALFAEHFSNLMRKNGRGGVIVPTGIATDATTAPFFGNLVATQRLAQLLDFENSAPIFPSVHRSYKFCLLTLGSDIECASFSFYLTDTAQLEDSRRRFTLSPSEIARINPNTKTAPVFRSQADAELTAKIYARVPVLIEDGAGPTGNTWDMEFRQGLFNMTSDSGLFRSVKQLEAAGYYQDGSDWVSESGAQPAQAALSLLGGLDANHLDLSTGSTIATHRYVPLYEAKMIHQFDHRFGDYGSRGDDRGYRVMPETPLSDYQDPNFEPTPFYYVTQFEVDSRLANFRQMTWLAAFKDVTASTNERTVIASSIPRLGVGHTSPLMFSNTRPDQQAALLASLNSLSLDYIARTKVAGLHLTYGFLKQFPILPPSAFAEDDLAFIVPRVLELSYTSHSMAPFARDLGYAGEPFAWDASGRSNDRAERPRWCAK
jgi:hypothetical protein